MAFIEKLVETKDSIKMKNINLPFGSYEDMGFRMFEHIQINDDIRLSIQASYGHYCSPRKTLPKEDYKAMEIAIFFENEFTSVDQVTDNQHLINGFEEYYNGSTYGYVPIGLIEGLYQELKGS